MNKHLARWALIAVLPVVGAHAEDVKLETETQKASYGVGVKYGEGLKNEFSDLDFDLILKGMNDVYQGKELKMQPQEIEAILQSYRKMRMEERRKEQQQAANANKETGEKFLAENANKDGVKTTESGLQYKVIQSGSGKSPSRTDTVKVHYHGTLIDGTVFDSSRERGQPAEFPVNRVIPGWTEALPMMKEGDRWQLYIPSDLAYGARGTPGAIGPNATLIFDVELLEVVQKAE